jgi:hypothetical protein
VRPTLASLCLLAVATAPCSARAGPLGPTQEISGPSCRFPDAAFDPATGRYLVVWVDYTVKGVFGRLLDKDGALASAPFAISDGTMSLFPQVASNGAGEFLVAWDDEGRANPIYGQRVRASDGAPIGGNFAIAATGAGIHPAVAFSRTSSRWLVVFQEPVAIDIHARLLAADGTPVGGDVAICQDSAYSGYPAVSWGEGADRFLVTWDYDVNNVGDVHGQLVGGDGALFAGPMAITANGASSRSNSAYDAAAGHFLVAYNDCSRPGNSFDQSGSFVRSDGTVEGASFPIAATTAFEGDTILGGDVAFASGARRHLSSFTHSTGMHVQELDSTGARVGDQVELAPGDFGAITNAADEGGRFLTVWEDLANPNRVFARLYEATAVAGADAGGPPDTGAAAGADAASALDAGPVEALDASRGDADAARNADSGSRPSATGSCGCAAPGEALLSLAGFAATALARRRRS